jgi:AcrR family transcriptional regulator
MAERGMANVSLRQITLAAGVGNVSAVRYHFRSRAELMSAVFRYRSGSVEARRLEYLSAMEERGQEQDQRQLAGALIYPLVPELEPRAEGNYYLRFMEQWLGEQRRSDVTSSVPVVLGWERAERRMKETVSYLPPDVVEFRIYSIRERTLAGMASIEATLQRLRTQSRVDVQIELLIDSIVAILAGPISSDVLRLLSAPKT